MKAQIKKDEWDSINYENLTSKENELIRKARRNGFAEFYPALPNWESQGINTLKAAKEHLNKIK